MNPNFNQQFNYQGSSDQFNQLSSDFDFQTPGPSYLSSSNQQSFNSFRSTDNNSKSTNYNSFKLTNSYSSTYSKQSSSTQNFGQFDCFGTMGENMFIHSSSSITPINSPFTDSFDQQNCQDKDDSYEQKQPKKNFDQQQNYDQDAEDYNEQSNYQQDTEDSDLVQNYGPRNSDVYREKRFRNNLAVRKARAKFTKKNKDLVERLVVLRKENESLVHQKEIVQGRYNEVKDIYDNIFNN